MDEINQVKSHYDERGVAAQKVAIERDVWEKIPLPLKRPYLAAYERIAALPRGSLLDVGCGTGEHSIHFAQLGYEVVGIDISSKSVDAARLISERQGITQRCRFLVADATRIKDLGKFDVIFSSGSLYYLHINSIKEIVRTNLRPGGHWIAVETNGDNLPLNLLRSLKSFFLGHRDRQTLQNLWRTADLESFLGLFDQTYVERYNFFDAILSLAPKFISRIPALGSFFATVDKLLLSRGSFRSLAFKILIEGQKK